MTAEPGFSLSELSPAHLELAAAVRDEWLPAGVATGPGDRAEAVAGAVEAYRVAGLEPPGLVLWFASPLAATLAAARLSGLAAVEPPAPGPATARDAIDGMRTAWRDRVRLEVTPAALARVVGEVSHRLRARVGSIGNLVADEVNATVWTTAEDVMIRELDGQLSAQGAADLSAEAIRLRPGRQVDEAFRGQFEVDAIALDDVLARLGLGGGSPPPGFGRVAGNAGWWWAFRGALVLSDRPVELHRDEHGQAHRADGPAVRYRDGFAVHAWHGLRVPPRVIAGDITGRYWLTEPSAKVRRVIAERIGYPRLLAEVPATRVHTDERGTLWRVDDPDRDRDISMSFVASEDVWLLELADGDASAPRSVRRVPPDTAGVAAAIAWTRDHPDDYRPPTPSY